MKSKLMTRIGASASVFALMCAPLGLSAQEAAEATVEVVEAAPVAAAPEATPTVATTGSVTEVVSVDEAFESLPGTTVSVNEEQDLISVTLNDVPLSDVVKMFTRISKANIVATSSNITGNVTASLTDVHWLPAMNTILQEHNLTLKKQPDSDIYRIVPVSPDAVPMVVKTLFLKYTTVEQILPVVKTVLLPTAMATSYPSRNALVLKTTEENHAEVLALLEETDIQAKQVSVETIFMELTQGAAEAIGVDWSSLASFGATLQAGPFASETVVERVRSRNNGGSQYNTRDVNDNLTRYYDMGGLQFEGVSSELPSVAPVNYIDTVPVLSPTRTIADTATQGYDYRRETTDNFTKTLTESQAVVLEMDALNIVLSALRGTDGVSVVSNPKMIVTSGAGDAFFSVGEREPIIKTEVQRGTQNSPGDNITSELDTSIDTDYITQGYLETGIELKVTPVVKTEDLIEAVITPSIRRKLGDKTVAGNSWPVISVKEIKTQFTLRSGQTVAVGGLTSTNEEESETRVPILGSIPLLRRLFSHEAKSQSQVETIIFVTLALAQPDTLTQESGIPGRARQIYEEMAESSINRQQTQENLQVIESTLETEE